MGDEKEPGSGFDSSPVYQPDPPRRQRWRFQIPDWLATAIVIGLFAISGLAILASIVACIVMLVALPWRFPAGLLGFGSVYLVASLPRLLQAVSAPLGWNRLLASDRARTLTSREWLRQRLTTLGIRDVEIIAPSDMRQHTAERYSRPDKTLLLSTGYENACGAAPYAHAARALARLILLRDRPTLALLPRLTGAAHALYTAAAGLLVGAVLVGIPALRGAALWLLPVAAVLQIAGTAFDLFVTRRAAAELRADKQLDGAGAELAIHQVKRHFRIQVTYAIAFLAVAILAAPVTASALTVAPPPLSLLTVAAAPPLTGTALWIAKLAAGSCLIGCLAMIVWRRLPQPLILVIAALGFATACATPTLVALTWDQLFTAAHPWAVALAVAASWSTVVGLLLFVPLLLFRLTIGRAFPEAPIHEKYEPRDERIAKTKQRMRSPLRGPAPALPLAIFGALWNLAILAQPLPLAYLAWQAL